MKKLFYGAAVALFAMVSCAKEIQDPTIETSGSTEAQYISVEIEAGAYQAEDETKASLKPIVRVAWKNGDAVSVIDAIEGKIVGTLKAEIDKDFKISEDESYIATFSGNVDIDLGARHTLYYIYPALPLSEEPDGKFTEYDVDLRNQQYDAEKPGNVCFYGYAVDDNYAYDQANPHHIAQRIRFNLVTAYSHLNMSNLPAAGDDLTSVSLSNVNGGFTWKLDGTDLVVKPCFENEGISVACSNLKITKAGNAIVRFAIPATPKTEEARVLTVNKAYSNSNYAKAERAAAGYYNQLYSTWRSSNVTIEDNTEEVKVTVDNGGSTVVSECTLPVEEVFKSEKSTSIDMGGLGATVTFDKIAAGKILTNATDSSSTSVFFKIEDVTETKPVQDANIVYEVTMKTVDEKGVEVFSEEKAVGVATIVVPLGENVESVQSVSLVKDDGTTIEGGVESYEFDSATNILTIRVKHFSKYAIKYKEKGGTFVAQIGEKKYTSLASAIEAVQKGNTIEMIASVDNAAGITVPSGKSFTVDFRNFGYDMKCPGAGSAGTKTIGFQLLKDSEITFKNGKITCEYENQSVTWNSDSQSKGIAMMIQNYANLTLENMTIDATNIAHNGENVRYAVSTNNGSTEFRGNTTIITQPGDIAFDSCDDDHYEGKPTVIWNSTGEFNHSFELSGGNFVIARDIALKQPIKTGPHSFTLTVNAKLTPDKNWNPEGTKDALIVVNRGGDLTINGTGMIDCAANGDVYSAVKMTEKGEEATGAVAKLTVDGNVTLHGYYYGISGNGSRHNTEITVNGGTINGYKYEDNLGIFHPQDGKLTINGGSIGGHSSAVEVRAGEVVISGGSLTATAREFSCNSNGDGSTTVGAALAIAQHTTKQNISVTVTGGTFSGVKAINESNPQANDPTPQVTMAVSGGKFKGEVSTADVKGFISGGLYSDKPEDDLVAEENVAVENTDASTKADYPWAIGQRVFVAQIGTKKYTSLALAVGAVGTGETIKVLKDVGYDGVAAAAGISVPSGKNFTVDFGGHKYAMECPGAGSANTMTSGFQLLKSSTVVFKNGTIECTEANKDKTWVKTDASKGIALMIQNYANLTLEDMTIDATNIAHNGAATRYAISNNSGNVEFKGATSIISADGDYAFDAYKYGTYTKPVVTWNSTGTVNGVIELSGGDFIVAKDLKVSRPIRSNSNPSTLTVNSGVTVSPAAKFQKVKTSFANDFNEGTSGVVIVNRGGNLTINGEGTITSTDDMYCYAAVSMTEKGEDTGAEAKLTVQGNVTLEGYYYGIAGNGNRHNTDITISGGTVKGIEVDNCSGIYHPQNGKLTINGGTIEGATGVYVKSGEVATVNGGTIKGTGTKTEFEHNNSGAKVTGDAFIVENCGYPGGTPVVNISGGNFVSEHAAAISSYGYGDNPALKGFITGGTFNTKPDGKLIKEGYKIKKESETKYTVSKLDANDVATINGLAYTDLATALSALQAGETIKIWKAGEYTVQNLSTPANTTVEGMAANRGVVFNRTPSSASWIASDAVNGRTVKNITWKVGKAGKQALHLKNVIGCEIIGNFYPHEEPATFTECVFTAPGYEYCIETWNCAEATFKSCTFNTEGKAMNVYGANGTYTFEDCIFNAPTFSGKGKAAIFVKDGVDTDSGDMTVYIKSCTANYARKYTELDQDDPSISADVLWNVEKGNHSASCDVKVYLDGNLVYTNDALVGISTPDQLKAFATAVNGGNKYNGLTVTLYADIDLNNTAWTPIRPNAGGGDKGFTFNGNGHTVSNLKIETEEKAVGFFGNATNAKISNLTIDGATVTGINHVAVLVGNGLCTQIENCTVKNATVESKVKNNDDGDKAAAICGYLSAEPNASIKNCYVENVTVKAYRDLAAIAGYANGKAAIVSGNTAKDVKVICNQANNYKNYNSNEQYDANQVVGENAANAVLDNNTCNNVTVEYTGGQSNPGN